MKIDQILLFKSKEVKDYYFAIIWHNYNTEAYLLEFKGNNSHLDSNHLCSSWKYGDDYRGLGDEIYISSLPKDALNFFFTKISEMK